MRSFARAVWGLVKLSDHVSQPLLIDSYSELIFPLNEGSRKKMPTVDEIHEFISRIYSGIALAPENCVMALAYIERLIALTGVTMHPTNWRRITIAALLLASKVWEDLAVHNRDMLRVFPQMRIRDLMELEHHFLEHLRFMVALKASVYAKYYFELRTLSQMEPQAFPLKPLTVEQARKIELRSRGLAKRVRESREPKRVRRRRSRSFGSLPLSAAQPRSVSFEDYQLHIALHSHQTPQPVHSAAKLAE